MSQLRKSNTTTATTSPKTSSSIKANDKKLNTNVQVVISKVSSIVAESSTFIGSIDSTVTTRSMNMSNKVEVSSDHVDELKFFSAFTLENLKIYVKKTKLNLFTNNGNSSEESTNSTSEQSLTDKEESSPKYNTRSNSINTQNQQKSSATKKLKKIERENSISDAEYLKKLDDNTTSGGLNEDYDSEISNIAKELSATKDSISRIRTRRRTSTPQTSNANTNKNKLQYSIGNSENSARKRTRSSNSSRSSSSSSRSSSSAEMKNIDMQCLPECGKAHCRLGCICEALQATGNATNTRGSISSNSGSSTSGGSSSANNVATRKNNSITNNHTNNSLNNTDSNGYRDHCGRFECMFECTCTRRLRSTTRNVRRSSNNSDNNSPNENVSNTKNKKGTSKKVYI
jgi:hypothetical protein